MPQILVELEELRAACRSESRAHGLEPSRGALGDQLDERDAPEAQPNTPAERTTP
jgi:hypothetical protein